ncbi:MAG: 5-(carboxyamino)imidazole ribonucleotide synthase [Actinomycetota bacterium]|nr:5-(carboxyamino)imidazole ribonucleotide synthase [Actinomycetota bacterium]
MRLGIVGGGQLAQMMIQAAISLGIEVDVLASQSDTAAPRYATSSTTVPAFDAPNLQRFIDGCDFVTFDHEVIEAKILRSLSGYATKVFPSPDTLELSSRKATCRKLMLDLGLPAPKFEIATNITQLRRAINRIGLPVIVKSSFGGYDGRGVFEVNSNSDLDQLQVHLPADFEVVVEEMVEIEKELSIIVVRDKAGNIKSYPLLETLQEQQMCSEVYFPVHVSNFVAQRAQQIAEAVANAVGSVGVLAVEMFLTRDGEVIVNELAPRPHNSGHLTIEAMVTSQFENHVRAVCSLPIGSVAPQFKAATMANLIGVEGELDQESGRIAALEVEGVHLHLYGKENRSRRKIGHITAVGDNAKETIEEARRARNLFLGVTN